MFDTHIYTYLNSNFRINLFRNMVTGKGYRPIAGGYPSSSYSLAFPWTAKEEKMAQDQQSCAIARYLFLHNFLYNKMLCI